MKKIFTLNFNTKTFNPDKTINTFTFGESTVNAEYKAPDHCVESIMNFARSYEVKESKATGKIEMILN